MFINAGRAGDAWSGGAAWDDPALVAALTRFVHQGGAFIGVGEPSACPGGDTFLRMAHVLGVDVDDGRYACHAKWEAGEDPEALNPCLRLTNPNTRVVDIGPLKLTTHAFGKGTGVYLGGFAYSPEAADALLKLLVRLTGADTGNVPVCAHPMVEGAWFPESRTLALLNNADEAIETEIRLQGKAMPVRLAPFETRFETVE